MLVPNLSSCLAEYMNFLNFSSFFLNRNCNGIEPSSWFARYIRYVINDCFHATCWGQLVIVLGRVWSVVEIVVAVTSSCCLLVDCS